MNNFWADLPRPFFVLAPMEAVTDVVFRQVVAKATRPDIFFTEFVNTDSYAHQKGRHSALHMLEFLPSEQPIVAQIWGTNPEHFKQMALDLKTMGFAGVDINMGCPAKNVIKTGACSALIENPTLAAEIIVATKESGLPVSVKTRLGFKTKKTEQWLGFLLQQNITALTIHGRTQKEMSKVPADWEEIAKAVPLRNQFAPQTLIIGNGDVRDRRHGEELVSQHGVDGIMIGRGVFANPFCFEKSPTQHSKEELLRLLNYQLDLFDQASQTAPRKYDPLKRFFKIYVRDFDGASEIRDALMHTKSTNEARQIINSLVVK